MEGQPMKTQTRRPKTLFENQRDIANHGKTTHETKHDIDFSRPVGPLPKTKTLLRETKR